MHQIITVAGAHEAIEAVVAWLAHYREPLTLAELRRCEAELSDETFTASIPYLAPRVVGAEASAYLARHWADLLLEASAADGCGGCLLCQG